MNYKPLPYPIETIRNPLKRVFLIPLYKEGRGD